MKNAHCIAGLLALSTALTANATNWPSWRGPDGTGVSSEKNFPLKWNAKENVVWRVDLPERGNSSPVVWGDRVFVTQATSADNRRTVMCFDRATGKLLWQSGVTYTEPEQTQRANPYCSASPVTDGERVIASFGSAGMSCYDFAGKELWHRDFGKMSHGFGNASSPMLAGDLCVLAFGPDVKARLIAVDKRTGTTVWEAEPPKVDPSEQQPPRGGFGGGPGGGPSGSPDGQRAGGPDGGRGGAPGGRGGGFNPGSMIAPPIMAQADKNADGKLTSDEFTNLADVWFVKFDTTKSGKLDQQSFSEKFAEVMPLQGGPGGGGDDTRRGGRPNFSGVLANGIFAAADVNKDAAITREELKTAFAKWFAEWDSEKAGAVDEAKLGEGLMAALPRPQFGGPGGPGGGGRGGRGPGGGGGGGGGGSWSTPVLIKTGGREELIMTFPNRVVAYEPKTGKQLWTSKGIGGTIYTSPVWGEGVLIASTSGPGGGGAVAVKPGGNGDVSDSQQQWRLERFKSAIGSGVIHDGYLYTISQDGIATCTKLQNGETVWEERLTGSGGRGSSWSSMLLADGKIYVPNQSGDVFVLRAAPKFELLATNSVNESTNASLAAANGHLFLRTDKALWCFGTAQ